MISAAGDWKKQFTNIQKEKHSAVMTWIDCLARHQPQVKLQKKNEIRFYKWRIRLKEQETVIIML